jgi:hypothetical protein
VSKKADFILPEDWEELVLAEYREGNGDVAVRALLAEMRLSVGACNKYGTMSKRLFDRWYEEIPEFQEVIDNGRTLSEAWWEKLGKDASAGKAQIAPAMWIFNMKNKFGWRDKKELTGDNGGAIKVQLFSDEEDV